MRFFVPRLTKWERGTIEFAIVCPFVRPFASNNSKSFCQNLMIRNNNFSKYIPFPRSCSLRENHHYTIKAGNTRATRTLVCPGSSQIFVEILQSPTYYPKAVSKPLCLVLESFISKSPSTLTVGRQRAVNSHLDLHVLLAKEISEKVKRDSFRGKSRFLCC